MTLSLIHSVCVVSHLFIGICFGICMAADEGSWIGEATALVAIPCLMAGCVSSIAMYSHLGRMQSEKAK